MRRIVLTGADGQVGWELRRTLAPLGQVLACTRHHLDLSEPRTLRYRLRVMKPDVIVNAAAYTAVDAAEALDDLRVPPGNRLEKLKGDRAGQHSIRINDQWRICFRWKDGNAHDVEIVDYH